jgi:hypothetical protein
MSERPDPAPGLVLRPCFEAEPEEILHDLDEGTTRYIAGYRTEDDKEWVIRIVLEAPVVDRAVLLNSTFGLQLRTDGTVIARPFSMEMDVWAEAAKKGSFQDETIDEMVVKMIELDRNETDAETVPDLRLLRDRLQKALAAVDAEIFRRGA